MGGFNSGRPRQRANLGQLLSMPIGYFKGLLGKGEGKGACKWSSGAEVGVQLLPERRIGLAFAVNGEPVEQRIATTATPCHYGGARDWFLCPSCNTRVGKLYLYRRRFVCRSCTGLSYRSQGQALDARLLRRHDHYRRRIDPKADELPPGCLPAKPRGMHWATYNRLAEKAQEAEEARMEALLPGMARLLERAGLDLGQAASPPKAPRRRKPGFWD